MVPISAYQIAINICLSIAENIRKHKFVFLNVCSELVHTLPALICMDNIALLMCSELVHILPTLIYTQRQKLRTAYSTNDYRGNWTVIYKIFILIYLALITK